ncbi:MAG: tRNA-specific adenosine deaminase [Acidimicrobiaceae bacterium]|jgi:tRNA(adenine34) deaminase|nr:tRNA-specific adenosine deaminase [Acidimicrobiaceae bacterium]MBD27337.1 tRNA-specific adenosine deaminase [Acidimicrobiaceae bacterium]CAI8311719.1 MAG: tRNA-specific adenosine deaminase [Acidimicrobiaceae bacterium]|tara:strand:- start:2454 stop:2903 length:450 start_codon:yes stop_codon:yes gene_type:complete
MTNDELMGLAIQEAITAKNAGEVPIGAVIEIDGRIVASRHNERETTNDPTAHAEILAIRDAAKFVKNWRLEKATLVVTLEPCPMCAGAIWASRVKKVIWGAPNMEAGSLGSLYNFGVDPRLNHQVEIIGEVRSLECSGLLSDFFAVNRQ